MGEKKRPYFKNKGESSGFNFMQSQFSTLIFGVAVIGLIVLVGKLGWF